MAWRTCSKAMEIEKFTISLLTVCLARGSTAECIEFVSKPEKGSCHSERSEEAEPKKRLFATLSVTIKTFYTVSITL